MRITMLVTIVIAGALAWGAGSRMSADAMAMAVGVLFGVLAGLPIALLLMASSRPRERYRQERERERDWREDRPIIYLVNSEDARTMSTQNRPVAYRIGEYHRESE